MRKRLTLAAAPRQGGMPAPDGKVQVRRGTTGRRGKAVTTVSGLPLEAEALAGVSKRLKKRCGVGGAVKHGVIELQGDHRDAVVEIRRADGYVVQAGG